MTETHPQIRVKAAIGRLRPALTPRRSKLLPILSYDRGGQFQANADGAALVHERTLRSNPPDDILGGQYWRHLPHTLRHSRIRS
jgi:hypothetical protein